MVDYTVVIPTYNAQDYVKAALSSVSAQTPPPSKVVVVDDGSTDNTVKLVEGWMDDNISIETLLIQQRNQGPAAARNRGIDHATGKYIAFLDSDDYWLQKKMMGIVDVIKESTSDVIAHDMFFVEDGERVETIEVGPYKDYTDFLLGGNCIVTSGTVVRRSVVEDAGGFCEDDRLIGVEDYDLWLRLAKSGSTFRYVSSALGIRRQHRGGISKQIADHYESMEFLLNKHFREVSISPWLRKIMRRKREADVLRGTTVKALRWGDAKESVDYAVRAVRKNPLLWRNWIVLMIGSYKWLMNRVAPGLRNG